MDKLKLAVCEDKKEEQEYLEEQISLCGIPAEITFFSSGEAFLVNYQAGSYDLVFMDIYMEEIDGVETVKRIRETDRDVLIAFTTTSLDHALEGYRLGVIKYLEKPVSGEEVRRLLETVRLHRRIKNKSRRSAASDLDSIPVPVQDLMYVEQSCHRLLFHLADGTVKQVNGKLDQLEHRLPSDHFFRSHKSYLVNLAFVSGIDQELKLFRIRGGKNVYIRRSDMKRARDAWESYLFQAANQHKAY